MGDTEVRLRRNFIAKYKAIVKNLKAGIPPLDPEVSEIQEAQIRTLEEIVEDLERLNP